MEDDTPPPPTIVWVDVTPGTATLISIGETVRLSATARDGSGAPVSGATFTWSSSDPGVAIVDASGVASAVADGTATITASASSVTSDPVVVTVDQAVASVVVTPPVRSRSTSGRRSRWPP